MIQTWSDTILLLQPQEDSVPRIPARGFPSPRRPPRPSALEPHAGEELAWCSNSPPGKAQGWWGQAHAGPSGQRKEAGLAPWSSFDSCRPSVLSCCPAEHVNICSSAHFKLDYLLTSCLWIDSPAGCLSPSPLRPRLARCPGNLP